MQLAKRTKGQRQEDALKFRRDTNRKLQTLINVNSEFLENKSKIKLAKQEKGQNNKGCYKLSKRYQERSQTLVNVTFEFLENKSLM